MNDCALLIIDDLGTEEATDSSVSRFYALLDRRMSRGLATVITTNLSLEAIRDVYTERVYSRLVGGFHVERMMGTDIRLQKKKSRKGASHA